MDWKLQEPGWYTATNIGGICQERNGKWYVYLLGTAFEDRKDPFSTLAKAKSYVNKNLLKGVK